MFNISDYQNFIQLLKDPHRELQSDYTEMSFRGYLKEKQKIESEFNLLLSEINEFINSLDNDISFIDNAEVKILLEHRDRIKEFESLFIENIKDLIDFTEKSYNLIEKKLPKENINFIDKKIEWSANNLENAQKGLDIYKEKRLFQNKINSFGIHSFYIDSVMNTLDDLENILDEIINDFNDDNDTILDKKNEIDDLENRIKILEEQEDQEELLDEIELEKTECEEQLNEMEDKKDDFTKSFEKAKSYAKIELNNIDFNDVFSRFSIIEDALEEIDNDLLEIVEDKELYKYEQEKILENNKHSLNDFIIEKKAQLIIKEKDKTYYVLSDKSIVLKENKEFKIINNLESIKKNLYIQALNQYCGYELRKHPTWSKIIKNIIFKDQSRTINNQLEIKENNLEALPELINNIIKYKDILKESDKISILINNPSKFKNKNIETLDDLINSIAIKHKEKKLMKSILSGKAKEYKTPEVSEIIKLLSEKFDEKTIKKEIGKKLSYYTNQSTYEEFLKDLKKIRNQLLQVSAEKIIKNINELPENIKNTIDIVCNNEDNLILKIDSYQACKKLGSPHWCITRSEYYYNQYKSNNNSFFTVFDFNKEPNDKDSMIGIHIEQNGNSRNAHFKNDETILNEKRKKIVQLIAKKNIETISKSNDPIINKNLHEKLLDKRKPKISI